MWFFLIIIFITCAEECKSQGWYLFKTQLTSLIKRKLWSKNFKRWFGRGRKLLSRAVSSNVTAAKTFSLQGFQKTHLWSALRSETSTLWWMFERRTGRSMMNRVAGRRSKRLWLTTRVPSSSLHFPPLSQAKGNMRTFQDRHSSPLSIKVSYSPFQLASYGSLQVSTP